MTLFAFLLLGFFWISLAVLIVMCARPNVEIRPTPHALPRLETKSPQKLSFMVRGYTHKTLDGSRHRAELYEMLTPGEPLKLVREPQNEFDPNAILIYQAAGPLENADLGYVPRTLAETLAPTIDGGAQLQARVWKVATYGKRQQFVKLYANVEMVSR